jgi:flagellar hook-basal body complex protein FliE
MSSKISFNEDEMNVKSFKDVVSDMMSEINEVTNKPDELVHAAMQGKADIHDVMSAVAQSELTVQAATTITGKILQTYEKIMQIQI